MKKGNLLIVDDEKLLVENIQDLLEDFAENIFTAHTGIEGLEKLKSNVIHCVVCDISMPSMGGIEMIKKVRELGMNVPFIFFTAYGHFELMKEVAKYGAFDFIVKPDFDGLEEVVARGLKEGFKPRISLERSSEEVLSEYQKILEEISKIQ